MTSKNNIPSHIDALMKQAGSSSKITTSKNFMDDLNNRLDSIEQQRTPIRIFRINDFIKYAAVIAIVIINLGILFSVSTESTTDTNTADNISQFADEYFPEYTALLDGEGQ